MNPTLVYQECIKSQPTDTTAEQIEKAKAEMDQSIAWKQWNMLAQTQEFRRILEREKQSCLTAAMRIGNNFGNQQFLFTANTLDIILNSVMINGRYETPSQ